MNDKEFEAVFSLPAQRRYAYLLKRVVDTERIWSLGTEEGWARIRAYAANGALRRRRGRAY
jgi:hypothetical protein